jgi:uncharacterized protein (DUF488 family)
MGYQSLAVDEFSRHLSRNGVKRVIDVRKNPISRKPGFSKKRFSASLDEHGIEYIHIRELGIPSEKRKNLNTEADYKKLLDEYENILRNGLRREVENVAALAKEKPSALVCFESDSSFCHRSRLAKLICEWFHMEPRHLRAV